MTKTNNIAIAPEAYQFIKNQFTTNGVTYAKIPKQYAKGKIADPKTREAMNDADSVYVRLGEDGKWYQTRMDQDAPNINYYFDNKPLIDRSNEIIDNQWEQGDGHKIAVNQADAKARQQWFSNEDATKFLLTTAGLGALGGGLISAPLATTLGLAGGYGGGKLVDKGMQLGTGKTWGEWMSDKTGLPEWFSEFTNPGGLIGAGLGTKMVKPTLSGYNKINNLVDKYFFVTKPGTYTRGIGMGKEGLLDAINTGVIRGNPRGTEQTAKIFTKMFDRNRGHFRDIIKDTGIKGLESKYQSRTLTRKEFNAIKKASQKYTKTVLQNDGNAITTKTVSADPLSEYPTYDDYISTINKDVQIVEQMPLRINSGEITVNNNLVSLKDGTFRGRPITERFGPNSDYVGDGHPLSYWYDNGRNPIKNGYNYAGSNYGVRVNNPNDYIPFMHELHLHPSFFKTPRLADPNVELFTKGPFGLTLKLNKQTMQPLLKTDLLKFLHK